ncbi:HEPN domain-containing protein [Cyanobium sp. BA20m-p-22]|uniref:HEPN domain-containing protein n=1 Tax=unclassified Cyanobium TaxID=2627006 RepID=UPI0020CC3CDD|nr:MULTISPECIES: HEPN domain-containing protein [unclassified Cyanobium]MCP9905945.1 HEPN domain-containing protein [Cyanobium sp. BA5m-21]MCP9909463.1 HEPN domain-containing protein [Cyanobium sp. BA20m-p-22]MCP9913852.1 HEPN domain-containing protein [Cyanobium sp. BA20m-14]
MSPAEDALLLLAIVRRHLRSLGLTLDPAYPDEDWGFTAQQVVEKLLKAWIVLADRQPPRVHDLEDLVALAGQQLDPLLLELQVFAVEARYEQGPFPLPASRQELLALVEAELERCERVVEAVGESAG